MKRLFVGLVAAALASTAEAQAPRDTATANLKSATVSIEYGQPPWNEDRLTQMEQQLPVGAAWRMGAEGVTTITIEGGPVFFGHAMLEPGTYGLNAKRFGDKEWGFVVFDDPSPALQPVHRGVRDFHDINGGCSFDGSIAERLTLVVAKDGANSRVEMQFGPIRVHAPIADVIEDEGEATFNGSAAKTAAYRRSSSMDLSNPTLAGYMILDPDDEECGMRYYVTIAEGQATLTFRHMDVEDCEMTIARADAALAQLEGFAGNPQVDSIISDMKRRKLKGEIMMEDYEGLPDNLIYTAAVEEVGGASSMLAKISNGGSGPQLELRIGTKRALFQLTESDFNIAQ